MSGMKLTTTQRYRLAIEAKCHERTVHRWEKGESINRAIRQGIEAAVKRLEIVEEADTAKDERAAG